MQLDELFVKNTRNIKETLLVADSHLTVIAGDNGQGKTSLLESIFLLTGSKSFRGAKDKELVNREAALGQIVGKTQANGRQSKIEIEIENGAGVKKGRFAKVNGVDYGRAAEIAGIFCAVVFEPNHLNLIKSGPDARRRFLDAALCQLYPGYLGILRRFSRALAQKNALLRQFYRTQQAEAMLKAFDTTLAQMGAEIICRRGAYLEVAAKAAETFYKDLSSGAEFLTIKYCPCTKADFLEAEYEKARKADIKAGFSTFGPQREDFEVLISGQSARTYGSQGQQRSAVLALKLAEAEMARQVTSLQPVLLLDDVLSELDDGRKAYLLNRMSGRQSFVSCCDASIFKHTAGKIIEMKNGQIIAD